MSSTCLSLLEAQRGDSEENETVTAMASLSVAAMEKRYSRFPFFLCSIWFSRVSGFVVFLLRTEDEPMDEEPPM